MKLLDGEKVSTAFLDSMAKFYVQQILTETNRRDLRFVDVEIIDDPALPTFCIEGAANAGSLLDTLAEIKGPAFNAAYEYAIKRFIRGDSPSAGKPGNYTER